jgi:hypothetical protein
MYNSGVPFCPGRNLRMAKYLVVLTYNCKNPGQEKEFNEWYENTHIPDALAQEDFIKVSRGETEDGSKSGGKYITICEIESDDLARTMDKEQQEITRLKGLNRLSDQFELVSRKIYKLISSTSKGIK